MYKFILVLTLLLAPFFSQSNIYVDADFKGPKSDSIKQLSYISQQAFISFFPIGTSFNDIDVGSFCEQQYPQTDEKRLTGSALVEKSELLYSVTCYVDLYYFSAPDWVKHAEKTYNKTDLAFELINIKGCPPDNFPTYSFPLDIDSDGEPDKCLDPNQLVLQDSCDINDSPNLKVTETNACYTKPDGSQCSVTAVSVGSGASSKQVYMGSEGNCYADPKPDISGNDPQGEPNQDGSCTNNGGLLACPEDPQNVCGESGSNYGGGSVNNCKSGCGYVNDAFTCYDTDIDDDGLPDYNDPDKDGDGIPNDTDLDADGNGKDDPINGGDGNQSGGGGVAQIDLKPVIDKLDKIEKSISETEVELIQEPTKQEEKKGFWESEYENGLEGVMDEKMTDIKATEFYGFLDKFSPNLGGGSAPSYDMCFNIGSLGNFGCQSFSIDPRVFPAIKIFILITAGFLCRKILFGG